MEVDAIHILSITHSGYSTLVHSLSLTLWTQSGSLALTHPNIPLYTTNHTSGVPGQSTPHNLSVMDHPTVQTSSPINPDQPSTQTDQIVLNSRATLLYDTTDWQEQHTGYTSRNTRQPGSQSSNQRNEQTVELETILSSDYTGHRLIRGIPYQPLPFFRQLHSQATNQFPSGLLAG